MNAIRHILCAAALLAVPAAALAASPLDGTWKGDVASVKFPEKPDVYLLKDGQYRCSTCKPAYTVAADGAFHKVAGHDYWDETSVKVVGDREVTYTFRKAGKQTSEVTDTVSADGATLTTRFRQTNNPSGTPVEGGSTATRIAAAPAGAHLVSGEWRMTKANDMSEAAIIFTYKLSGDMVALTVKTGESYKAKVGGPPAPLTGDPGKSMIAVKMPDARTIEETTTRAGKVTNISRYSVAADGVTMNITSRDPRDDTTTTYVARKQ